MAAIGGKLGFRPLRRVLVTRAPKNAPGAGHLIAGSFAMPCALGAGGIRAAKREGDGVTPAGRFRLLSGFFRSDRLHRPASVLRLAATRRDSGWCDDPSAPVYNRAVRLPFAKSHEAMWRQDRFYDVVVVIDYNIAPRRKSRGSAIFLHIATENYAPTAGCVALSPRDMRRLLPRLARDCVMIIR